MEAVNPGLYSGAWTRRSQWCDRL